MDQTTAHMAMAMAGATSAARTVITSETTRDRIERAYTRGGMDAVVAELDERLADLQAGYRSLAE